MPKVLVADDSIAVRKVAERLLTEAGFGVVLAANGEEALAYLAKEKPDLIVSDVIMPDKSGYEVCAFVRGHRALANTPVLLISGIVNDEVTKQAESCHADGVLKKPFQGTSLKDRVIELLAKRQGAAAPAAKSTEKVTASNEPIQSARVSDEQLASLPAGSCAIEAARRRTLVERDRATHSTQRVAQLEGQLAERQRTRVDVGKGAGADRPAEECNWQRPTVLPLRVQELEIGTSETERDRTAERQEAGICGRELQARASVQELEAALYAERQAAAQLVRTDDRDGTSR